MKTLVILAHAILGGILIFYAGITLILSLYQLYHPSAGAGVVSLMQILTLFLLVVLGFLSILSSVAFKEDKRWAVLSLPLTPSTIGLLLLYIVFSSPKSDFAWTGGIINMFAIALLLFSIIEVLYITLRKPPQNSLPPV